mmetsp:Transcript_4291/g.10467  ORF Transcript_4291/g.10467 Transcript_4291/m.10467 type:complete len:259 (+) Transcript_4291:1515-2291(+)
MVVAVLHPDQQLSFRLRHVVFHHIAAHQGEPSLHETRSYFHHAVRVLLRPGPVAQHGVAQGAIGVQAVVVLGLPDARRILLDGALVHGQRLRNVVLLRRGLTFFVVFVSFFSCKLSALEGHEFLLLILLPEDGVFLTLCVILQHVPRIVDQLKHLFSCLRRRVWPLIWMPVEHQLAVGLLNGLDIGVGVALQRIVVIGEVGEVELRLACPWLRHPSVLPCISMGLEMSQVSEEILLLTPTCLRGSPSAGVVVDVGGVA